METHEKQNVKILVCSHEYSTCFLFRVYTDPDIHEVEFITSHSELLASMRNNIHDIYVIDANDGKNGVGQKFYDKISEQNFKGRKRVILITPRPLPPEANRMVSFGPVCYLEYNFTRKRLRDAINQIFIIKDSGARVKVDERYFDITAIDEK